MIPTFSEAMVCYEAISKAERAKSGRPCEATVKNTIKGTRQLCRAARIGLDSLVSELTRKKLDDAIIELMSRGLSRVSVWSFVSQFRSLFTRWTRPYYRDFGWEIPELELPVFRARPSRYRRPDPEMLAKVKKWYSSLDGELWFLSTMMLEFAMRNGDILRLTNENFVEREGRMFLHYTPHKTELTSGRTVFWPIHPEIWAKFNDIGRLPCLDVSKEMFAEMNRQLRSLGFKGSKAAYELRKICIDHVYQKFGAEMATSISGDDIKTITRYYADPSQPNIGNTRIVDLL